MRGSKEPWLLLAMGSRRLWVLSRVAGMWIATRDWYEGYDSSLAAWRDPS